MLSIKSLVLFLPIFSTFHAVYCALNEEYYTTGIPYNTTGIPYNTTGIPYNTTGIPYNTTEIPYNTTEIPHSSFTSRYIYMIILLLFIISAIVFICRVCQCCPMSRNRRLQQNLPPRLENIEDSADEPPTRVTFAYVTAYSSNPAYPTQSVMVTAVESPYRDYHPRQNLPYDRRTYVEMEPPPSYESVVQPAPNDNVTYGRRF